MYQFTKLKIVFSVCDECISFNMAHVIKSPFIAEARTGIKYNDMYFNSLLNKSLLWWNSLTKWWTASQKIKQNKRWKPLHWKYSSRGWICSCNRFWKKKKSLLNMWYLPKLVLCHVYPSLPPSVSFTSPPLATLAKAHHGFSIT